MGYDNKLFIGSFADRTMKNLQILKMHAVSPDKKVYEVTQLVNSLFGMLIVPFEFVKPYKDKSENERARNYWRSIEKYFLRDKRAYDDIKNLINTLKDDYRYYNDYKFDNKYKDIEVLLFVEHLRNSLAHGGDNGISFYPVTNEGTRQIQSIIFRDKDVSSGSVFVAELKIEPDDTNDLNCQKENELRRLVNDLNDIYVAIPKRGKYENDIVKGTNLSKIDLLKNLVGNRVLVKTGEDGARYISEIERRTVNRGKFLVEFVCDQNAYPCEEYEGKILTIIKSGTGKDEKVFLVVGPGYFSRIELPAAFSEWIGKSITIKYNEDENYFWVSAIEGSPTSDEKHIKAIIVEGEWRNRLKIDRNAVSWFVREDTGELYIMVSKQDVKWNSVL